MGRCARWVVPACPPACLPACLQKHEKSRRELAAGQGQAVDEVDENFIRLYWEQMLQVGERRGGGGRVGSFSRVISQAPPPAAAAAAAAAFLLAADATPALLAATAAVSHLYRRRWTRSTASASCTATSSPPTSWWSRASSSSSTLASPRPFSRVRCAEGLVGGGMVGCSLREPSSLRFGCPSAFSVLLCILGSNGVFLCCPRSFSPDHPSRCRRCPRSPPQTRPLLPARARWAR